MYLICQGWARKRPSALLAEDLGLGLGPNVGLYSRDGLKSILRPYLLRTWAQGWGPNVDLYNRDGLKSPLRRYLLRTWALGRPSMWASRQGCAKRTLRPYLLRTWVLGWAPMWASITGMG